MKGSAIGIAAFCVGGTFSDKHGNDKIGLVDRTFRCPEGALRVGFTPGVPKGQTQSGPWKILSGTGALAGMQGSGQMKIVYDSPTSDKAHETFTGSILR